MLESLIRLLFSNKGEVGDDVEAERLQETAPATEEPTQDPSQEDDQGGLYPHPEESAIPQEAQPQAQEEDTFLQGATLDPKKLPAELQPIFKKMQGAYTKKMQQASQWRQQAEVVNRFYNDRDFAYQTLAQWAGQNGYQLSPVGQAQPQAQVPATQQGQGQVDQGIVESIKANLPQELQWMAESVAPAIQNSVQQMLAPLAQQLVQSSQSTQRQVMEREYDQLADELSNIAPGWEEHETEMTQLLDFLQSPSLRHPKYGSKHQLLYNLVTGNAAATAQVTNRMQRAAKNRPSSSLQTPRVASNMAERIRKAASTEDAFRLAAQAAESSIGG